MSPRGRHPHNRLTAVIASRAGPGRHSDGNGLYLLVRPTGSRYWIQRITINGCRTDLGIGPFALVTLAEARRIAIENLLKVRDGRDPRVAECGPQGPSFREVLDTVTGMRGGNWKTKAAAAAWHRGFDKYVLPVLGDLPVGAITIGQLEKIVRPHWKGRNSSGHVLRQNLESVFAWAVVAKHRPDNPAADLKLVLPKRHRIVNPQPSLAYAEVPEAMADWQALPAQEGVKLAVLFIVLTAARLSEGTGARWSEIDFRQRVWNVPAGRMKAGKKHTVPLSDQAIGVLRRAQELKFDSSLVFALRRGAGRARPVSQETSSYWLRKLGRVDDEGRRIVVHGFRASFRTWAEEKVDGSFLAAEFALAHDSLTDTQKAYNRTKLKERRAVLMQQWADYVLPRSAVEGEG